MRVSLSDKELEENCLWFIANILLNVAEDLLLWWLLWCDAENETALSFFRIGPFSLRFRPSYIPITLYNNRCIDLLLFSAFCFFFFWSQTSVSFTHEFAFYPLYIMHNYWWAWYQPLFDLNQIVFDDWATHSIASITCSPNHFFPFGCVCESLSYWKTYRSFST